MLRARIKSLAEASRGSGLRARLVRGGIGSAAVKALGVGLSLAMALVLARVLGAKGYGIYSYVFALVGIMAIPAQFGLPQLVIRETARAQASGDWPALKGIWRWAGAVAAGLLLLIVTLGGLAAWLLADRFGGIQIATFAWGLALVLALVLSRLRGAALKGLRHVVAGQLPDVVLRPGLLVIFVLAVSALGLGGALTPDRAMALHALAAGFAFIVGAVLLRWVWPQEAQSAEPRFQHQAWSAATLPLGLTAGMMVINRQADILLLGVFVDPEQVGIYRIAVQGSMLVAFGLQAVNMVVAPQLTRLHNQGDHQKLQRLVTGSARVSLAVALPLTLVFALFGDGILRVVVGADYMSGSVPLAILAFGQLVNAGMGPVGLLLNMTDQEAIVTRTVALAAMVNICTNLVLIPLWGITGAAVATTATVVLWNALLVTAGWNRLKINSTAIAGRGLLK